MFELITIGVMVFVILGLMIALQNLPRDEVYVDGYRVGWKIYGFTWTRIYVQEYRQLWFFKYWSNVWIGNVNDLVMSDDRIKGMWPDERRAHYTKAVREFQTKGAKFDS